MNKPRRFPTPPPSLKEKALKKSRSCVWPKSTVAGLRCSPEHGQKSSLPALPAAPRDRDAETRCREPKTVKSKRGRTCSVQLLPFSRVREGCPRWPEGKKIGHVGTSTTCPGHSRVPDLARGGRTTSAFLAGEDGAALQPIWGQEPVGEASQLESVGSRRPVSMNLVKGFWEPRSGWLRVGLSRFLNPQWGPETPCQKHRLCLAC